MKELTVRKLARWVPNITGSGIKTRRKIELRTACMIMVFVALLFTAIGAVCDHSYVMQIVANHIDAQGSSSPIGGDGSYERKSCLDVHSTVEDGKVTDVKILNKE